MYTQVANKLVLDASGLTSPLVEHSQAVSLEGMNSLYSDVEVFNATGGTLTVNVQVSNDLENWDPIQASGGGGFPGITFTSGPTRGEIRADQLALTSASYARLEYTVDAGGQFALAAGINTDNL